MRLNLKDLEETKIYYEKELEDEDLTGEERNSYLKALKLIEGFIEREEETGEIEKHKKIIPYDHKKAIYQNSKRGY